MPGTAGKTEAKSPRADDYRRANAGTGHPPSEWNAGNQADEQKGQNSLVRAHWGGVLLLRAGRGGRLGPVPQARMPELSRRPAEAEEREAHGPKGKGDLSSSGWPA